MIDLTSKLGEINGIEHNKGRNISSKSSDIRLYYVKQVLSIILIWVIVVFFYLFFNFLFLGKKDMVLGKRVSIFA